MVEEKFNNTLIMGKTTKDNYLDAIINYCDPEDLLIVKIKGDENKELDGAINELEIKSTVSDGTSKTDKVNKIILFKEDRIVGINDVIIVEQAVKSCIPIILLPS